ncbi:hypothetical protein GDO78_013849 [Eleutherodactylus coqui]|uniref:Uncharacterized protein n=1 Tax=Eleutherodactylus coqui TaxID=57060 RepID=A0A8J6EFH0_ELECQ|nr:hypothetical protein GDO78_013849 [Eleutherodactylus coqui]KAG9468045.1 hypothetical protein GDO78_013849 [Eleutherodactylus coqui]
MEDVMYQKLNQIREIMEKCKEITKGKKSSQLGSGHKVAIMSALEENVEWLFRVIGSSYFQEVVTGLNRINIMNMKTKNLEKLLAEYTFCFYVSNEEEWTQGASPSKRVKSLSAQGKKNLVVVIDDIAVSSDEEKTRLLKQYPDISKYSKGLLLFSRTEKELVNQKLFSNLPQLEPDKAARGSVRVISPKVVIGIRHKVGVFFRSEDRNFSWLMTLLTSEAFRDHVLSVRPCFISNSGHQQLEEDLSHCTFGILYHTKNRGKVNITDMTDSLYDEELQRLSVTLEKKNIIVVIDDVEDSSDHQKSLILHSQPKIATYANDLVLVSHQDKTDNMGQEARAKILRNFLGLPGETPEYQPANTGNDNQAAVVSSPTLERSQSLPPAAPPELTDSFMGHATPTPSRSTVGVFSRSQEGDYGWLRGLLTSEEFGHKDVLCYKISGSDNEALRAAAFKSKFGILYHSLKNGKIRLTDVKDSLYHEELEQLSAKLGKRRMIVVIDDLDDSGDKMKQKILIKQPGLGRLAADIFLFTAAEKKDLNHEIKGKHKSKISKSTREKISNIKKILT